MHVPPDVEQVLQVADLAAHGSVYWRDVATGNKTLERSCLNCSPAAGSQTSQKRGHTTQHGRQHA